MASGQTVGFGSREQRTGDPPGSINNRPSIATYEGSRESPNARYVAAPADPESFLRAVENRFSKGLVKGTLAYVEIVGPHEDDAPEPYLDLQSANTDFAEMFNEIGRALQPQDAFCWYGGRFIVLVHRASHAPRVLREISRSITNRDWRSATGAVHLTPIVGYIDLQSAASARELWQMAEQVLQIARTSLDVEPLKLTKGKTRCTPVLPTGGSKKRTGQARLWLLLAFQLMVSMLIGLGVPFILYAVCDALGSDISGPIYIGVVIVLVITATTIWIEGFLALKATTPPSKLGSPYPPATLIIPAYLPNEADTIMETLYAFLKLDYQNAVQIIVAYNCPVSHLPVEDEMLALAAEQAVGGRFFIEPVRVAGSTSKAQNVNAVVGRVRGKFVGIFDADHHPHADSLERAWRWLSNGWDIVQGRCAIRNGTDSWISRMVAIEFEQIYAVSHPGRARFHGFGIFGGSNGFWRTPVLHETRMRHSMLTEDIDSSIRAIIAGYKITGDRDLVSEELAPTTMTQLLNQRLRWAQGWFQVSFRRVMPALVSPQVTFRQKLGLIHLLIWRELFPWYSIQVVPIMTYWVWVYGWSYIQWTVPIFVATTIYTVSTGPGQIFFAYRLAQKPMQRRRSWFFQYLLISTFFYSPFKDALSRIAHVKEAMREKAWKVTPRVAPAKAQRLAVVTAAMLVVAVAVPVNERVQAANAPQQSVPYGRIMTLLGGEAATIHAARVAAHEGRNAKAANLFAKAIRDVPGRRGELLQEYADTLTYSNRSGEAVPLYRELLSTLRDKARRKDIGSHLALALTWSKQFAAALVVYDDLLRGAPGDADLSIHRARVLASLDRPDDAVAALDRVPAERWSGGPLGSLGNEVLVNSARSKASAGQSAAAALLFKRVLQRDGGRTLSLTKELAVRSSGGATSGNREGTVNETIGDDRAALARLSPDSLQFRVTQRHLAERLAAQGDADAAIEAWAAYLRHSPGDAEVQLRRAGLLLQLHRDAQARDAFQMVYARDRGNRTARAGIVDATVSLARTAARENRNEDARALFETAIRTDPKRRKEFLREYADQLNFTGSSAVSTPLYSEILASGALSATDRKRAMAGLADSYAWSNRLPEARAAYGQLVAAYPDDKGFQWSQMVAGARDAARADRNAVSADLFAGAIALDANRSAGILREYADQLSFTDRAVQAVPIYTRVLAQPGLAEKDALVVRIALAQAYEWSDRLELAKAAYSELVAQSPQDETLQWKLLVVSGREAARDNRNWEAAEIFARAIKLDPERSINLLAEYGDQLSFTGRAETAIGFYAVALKRPKLTTLERAAIDRGLAQAYGWSERYAEANAIYTTLLAEDPNNDLLRWQSLVNQGRAAGAADQNKEAAQFFVQAIRLLPGRRSMILKEYADKLAYSGRTKLAIPLYREILAHPLSAVEAKDAGLALAMALGWDHQGDASLLEYRRLASTDPDNVDAGVGIARALSLAGRQSDAKAAYRHVLASSPGNGEAQRGLAEAEDWVGHHRAAQAILARRLQLWPNDLEARRLLAQSLVWSGRPDKALEEVDRALRYRQLPIQRSVAGTRQAVAAPSSSEKIYRPTDLAGSGGR